jgi:hypothetical protein
MEYICDLSSSKAALPVQKYVEEYSIITNFQLAAWRIFTTKSVQALIQRKCR